MSVKETVRRMFRDFPAARLATVDPAGSPHLVPLWFVWRDDAIYLSLPQGSTTWHNAELDPRVAALIDRGGDSFASSGVSVEGSATLFPAEHPDVRGAMSGWHEKYRSTFSGEGFERFTNRVPSLGFLRLEPAAIGWWDDGALGGPAVVPSRGRP